MSGPSEDYVDLVLDLPEGVADELDDIAKIGILGSTREEVMIFILRQALSERYAFHQQLKKAKGVGDGE